ncbi:unnamed protein product [Cyprideis torosa]|uniref:Uncharacterized protein n=1 Tax=Cyprideis torosa TaxID=163714 RepID=A0A7R8WH63_9CRUS|nr:unnamed protein product [Cyprideis torosa]CAG0897422.1 unnamed protein product [Cyprideis torosa]
MVWIPFLRDTAREKPFDWSVCGKSFPSPSFPIGRTTKKSAPRKNLSHLPFVTRDFPRVPAQRDTKNSIPGKCLWLFLFVARVSPTSPI